MRKRLLPAALAAAGTLFLAIPALPAGAAGPPVLTLGSVGGAPVQVGDILNAPLASGTSMTFSSAATCKSANFQAKVTANPDSSGAADAQTEALAFSSCTTGVTGASKVNSFTLNNQPYLVTVDPAGDVTVSAGSGESVAVTLSLQTVLGAVTCNYGSSGALTGTFHNSGSTITFGPRQFTLTSGPGLCPSTGVLSFTLGPVTDTTQGGQRVFVNPGQN